MGILIKKEITKAQQEKAAQKAELNATQQALALMAAQLATLTTAQAGGNK